MRAPVDGVEHRVEDCEGQGQTAMDRSPGLALGVGVPAQTSLLSTNGCLKEQLAGLYSARRGVEDTSITRICVFLGLRPT